jgi:hypothetical protein
MMVKTVKCMSHGVVNDFRGLLFPSKGNWFTCPAVFTGELGAGRDEDLSPMNKHFRAIMLAAAFTTSMGAASMAEARTYHTNQVGKYYVTHSGKRVYVERYDKNCRSAANKGTAIGAVGGGVLGHVLGNNTTTTVVGAGVGAVAGHQIAKNNCKNR